MFVRDNPVYNVLEPTVVSMVQEHSQEPADDHTQGGKDGQNDQSVILYPTAERLLPFNRWRDDQ